MFTSFAMPRAIRATPMTRRVRVPRAEMTSLDTGILFYAISFAALTAYEAFAVPQLKLHGIIPDVPLIAGMLTEREKQAPMITPITADMSVPPPDIRAIRSSPHRVGAREGVPQFIAVPEIAPPLRPSACEKSEEWTDFYGEPICIFKRKHVSG